MPIMGSLEQSFRTLGEYSRQKEIENMQVLPTNRDGLGVAPPHQMSLPMRNGYGPHDSFLKGMVESQDFIPETERISKGYTHVSSLIKTCPRKYALIATNEMKIQNRTTPSDRLVWAFGRAAEEHVRTQWIKAMDFRGVYGNWTCKCGNIKNHGFYAEAPACDRCGTKAKVYKEHQFLDEEYRIAGNTDFMFMAEQLFYITEVKSMTGDKFDKLKEPEGDHIMQAFMYHALAKRAGFDVADRVIIFYVSKKYDFRGSPYKEFHVQTNTEFYRNSIARFFGIAMDIKTAILTGKMPARTFCNSLEDKMASTCPVVSDCFSRK